MRKTAVLVAALCGVASLQTMSRADAPRSAREALHPFNKVIGSWKGTATPAGTRQEQQQGFWIETLNCEWQFKGEDAWIAIDFANSKHFVEGELRYDAKDDRYALTLLKINKDKITYRGKLDDEKRILTLDHITKDETQRLVVTMLHFNRFLYRYDVKPAAKSFFTRVFQVGATKMGVPFVAGDIQPECVVSGGLGTSAVSFEGKTYYVCCSGCRDEFNLNPAKYVKEYEAKKKAGK